LRGPGELLGQNQSGLPPLRFGDLTADRALIERARNLAATFLSSPKGDSG
jgi:ATP-dependent DNA helicase RecG